MPTALSKNIPLSTNFTKNEEAKASEQGIVSILSCDYQNNNIAVSLRRTLSVDSSIELFGSMVDSSSSSSSDDEVDCEEETEPKTQSDSAPEPCDFLNWGSILTAKDKEGSESSNPAPYVHPLMKRSSSTLSGRSLEICTENLGSETGSDGFSSSENGDAEDQQGRSMVVTKSSSLPSKKSSCTRSFPPPLPFLSKENGSSVSMRARRDNGRLLMDAVTVPSLSNFQAQRQGGRLILTLVNCEEEEEETEEEPDVLGEVCEEEVVEFKAPKIINVQKLALLMNKSIELPNRNPAWPNKKFNESAKEEQWPGSVPLQATVGTNAYEYFWRAKSTTTVSQTANSVSQTPSSLKTYTNNCFIPIKLVSNEIQDPKAVWNGSMKGFNLAPLVKTCNEPRKSLIFWGKNCIATS